MSAVRLAGAAPPDVRVLLVDDDEEDAMLARELLAEAERTRFSAAWAPDTARALQALARDRFDAILLDLKLGAESGLELLAELRRAGMTLPIIVMTSASEPELDERAMTAGATDYLVKGRSDSVLLERTIRYALSHHRQREQLEIARADLERSNGALAAMVRRQNEILGMAAHDLRSPLGIVHAYATFLRARLERLPIVEQRDVIERIGSSVQYMVTLIDDLLDLSAIESGTISLALDDVDMREMLARVVELERMLAGPKGIRFLVETPDRPVPSRLDPRRFQQLLQNLLDNARKYSEPGGEVRVRLTESRGAIRISVEDRGPGIAPELLDGIFAPFVRKRREGTSGERSTGLGLAIARRIVDAHGGRIWVESELGAGARFHVEIDRVDR